MIERWLQTCKNSNVEVLRQLEIYTIIDTMYRAGNREYHNLKHIEQCFKEFDMFMATRSDMLGSECLIEVEMALWFHDIFYDVTKKDNEKRSADLAETIGQELFRFVPQIADFVMATKHDRVLEDKNKQLIADIDLSILGQSYGTYREYQSAVYREYGFERCDLNQEFLEGRAGVLEAILVKNNDNIYYLGYFVKKYGKQAFTNIHRELIELKELLRRF